MITPKIKDEILSSFIECGMSCETNIYNECEEFQLTHQEYAAVVSQLEEMNLLKTNRCMDGTIFIFLTANAHDFFNRGGFAVQEEILKANINKLGLELETLSKELEPKFAEKAARITVIANNILSVVKFFE